MRIWLKNDFEGLPSAGEISLRDEAVVGLLICGGVLFGQGAKLHSGSARACYPRH